MKTKSYSEKLKDPRWQKKRLQVLERDSFTCRLCFDEETELHIHHKKYTKEPYDAPIEDLSTLCKYCHFLLEEHKKNGNEVVDCHKTSDGNRIYKFKNGFAGIAIVENGSIVKDITFNDKSDTVLVLHNILYNYDNTFLPWL